MLNRNKYKIMAVMLLFIMGLFAVKADINFVNYEVFDEMNANYEFNTNEDTNVQLDYSVNFPYKLTMVDINGLIRRMIGQREMNGVLKLKNGHLILPQEKENDSEVKKTADEVIQYAAFCKKEGKAFVYVQPILKVDENDKQLPKGTFDYSNENIDRLLDYLRNAQIEVIDIRECMHDDNMNLYDYTYKTDHHWTVPGSFYAFQKITEWIDKTTGVKADSEVTALSSYRLEEHAKWHLGSYGQRTGQYFAGIDDYDFLVPTFDVTFDDNGTQKSFYESVVNSDVFAMRDPTSRYTYDHALRVPEGTASTSKNLSVLLISDSYSTAMRPYLKLAYSDCDEKYMPDGLKASDVLEDNPDVIIMMPYYTSTFNPNTVYIAPTE